MVYIWLEMEFTEFFVFYIHMELLCYCVVLCYYCFANHTKPDLSELQT